MKWLAEPPVTPAPPAVPSGVLPFQPGVLPWAKLIPHWISSYVQWIAAWLKSKGWLHNPWKHLECLPWLPLLGNRPSENWYCWDCQLWYLLRASHYLPSEPLVDCSVCEGIHPYGSIATPQGESIMMCLLLLFCWDRNATGCTSVAGLSPAGLSIPSGELEVPCFQACRDCCWWMSSFMAKASILLKSNIAFTFESFAYGFSSWSRASFPAVTGWYSASFQPCAFTTLPIYFGKRRVQLPQNNGEGMSVHSQWQNKPQHTNHYHQYLGM